jgi:hypothetical protein
VLKQPDKQERPKDASARLIVLIAGILALTAPNFLYHAALSEGTQKMAAGWVGLVIGYWLS